MAKVLYKRGTKATYLGLPVRDPNALYFCTDTRELFKGDDLYTDGVRLVDSYATLPAFDKAADGVMYLCRNNGCCYVLNEARDQWINLIHGVDNETVEVNTDGLIAVKTIAIEQVSGLKEKLESIEPGTAQNIGIATDATAGLVKASTEIAVAEDGTMNIVAVSQRKIAGLEDRLNAIEASIIGGVRYCGSVESFDALPANAKQGDLYEVTADGSEWCFNGEKWFEYGTAHPDVQAGISREELSAVAEMVMYDIPFKPVGTLVNKYEKELRVMCPVDTNWTLQQSGENADPNAYYIGFRAYAPNDSIVGFKEDLGEIISDPTMYNFEGDFAGIDEYGRKYSIVWLPVAAYNEADGTWSYYGEKSNKDKCIGWFYSVEWYDADGVRVAADTIRINLTNEDCHSSAVPYYVAELQGRMETIEDGYVWGDM